MYEDRNLTCQDCGASFVFTADDQQYHAQKGYTNEPKRCPDCRRARKAARGDGGGGGGYGGGGGGGSYSSGPRQMYPAKCASCGRDTEVPFQPRGDRPVYCRDCFQQQQASGTLHVTLGEVSACPATPPVARGNVVSRWHL